MIVVEHQFVAGRNRLVWNGPGTIWLRLGAARDHANLFLVHGKFQPVLAHPGQLHIERKGVGRFGYFVAWRHGGFLGRGGTGAYLLKEAVERVPQPESIGGRDGVQGGSGITNESHGSVCF